MILRGPFSIRFGANPILDVSEIGFNYEVATNDYQTVQGDTYHTEGAIDVTVDLTLLASDVEALSTLIPQYYVAKGGTLSTGETVTADEGAIDVVAASCDTSDTSYDLDITSCNGVTIRIKNARTRLSTFNLENNDIITTQISFIGQANGKAIMQILMADDVES